MIYLSTLKVSFLLFFLVAFLITIPFILIEYHKYGAISKMRVLIIYSFVLYLMTAYLLVILPLPNIDEVAKLTTPKMRLIPFAFVIDFIKETPLIWSNPSTYLKALKDPSFYTVFFNILMTVPFGMYLRYFFQKDLKTTIKYSFFLSLFFELTQLSGLYFIYPRPYRLFDVDDLMMNTLGGIIGFLLMGKLAKFLPTREDIDKKTRETSQMVSGFRRITLFYLDFTLFTILSSLENIIFPKSKWLKYVLFFLYFVFIPYFWHGKTIGSNYLNVKFCFKIPSLVGLFIKVIIQIIYYMVFPFGFMFIFNLLISNFNLEIGIKFLLLILSFMIFVLYYFVNILHLIKNKKMFYDKFSTVEFVSTLQVDNNKNH